MQIMMAAKKVDGQYEAALLIDGKFTRSTVSKSLTDLMMKLLGPILTLDREDGSEVSVNVGILDHVEVARQEAKERNQRKIAEATAEAEQQEALNASRAREIAARSSSATQPEA